MFADPLLDLTERFAPGCLRGQLRAELGLVAGASEKDDEVPGDGQCRVPAVVLLDQGEREIDARGDSGGGGELPVPHEDRIRVDVHGGVRPGQVVADGPVRGDPMAVQQSGRGEQQCPRADGDDALGARGVLAQPVGQPGVGVAGAPAAGDQQGVRVVGIGQGAVRDEGEAAGGTDGGTVDGGRTDPVRLPRTCPAPENTSTGPVTSRLCRSSKRTTSTDR